MKINNLRIACLKQVYKEIIVYILLFALDCYMMSMTLKYVNTGYLGGVLIFAEAVLLVVIFHLLSLHVFFVLEPVLLVKLKFIKTSYDFTEKYRKAQESLDSTSNP